MTMAATMHMPAEYALPLELLELDDDPDRMREWWVLDSNGVRIARFFDQYTAQDFLAQHDYTYSDTKI